jgi:outer membrane protein OmpA-like peptidoglycan-associated protein
LSRVRVHSDARAVELSQALRAEAFTHGNDIYFNEHRFAPSDTEGKRLLAHELAHVSQQTSAGAPSLQRRLLLTGAQADIDDFIAMSETASGLVLLRDPVTNEVTAIAQSVAPATSPSFAAQLTNIMDAPLQDAEINVGTDQPGVDIGAFPNPPDLTAGGVQNVDMDDINAMEAGAPGIGVADLLHEIVENFEAHANAPVPGVDLFPPAHEAGLQAEADVARDIVASGRRVAQAVDPIAANITRIAEDYDDYYVLSTLTETPNLAGPPGFSRSNVSFAPKVVVTTVPVDGFGTNSDAFPPAGAATVAGVVAALTANPLATVRIEGFTDNVGTPANNLDLGGRRAESAALEIQAAGIDGGRIQQVARGETGFVALNDTEPHRAQNRRVVFTVTRP